MTEREKIKLQLPESWNEISIGMFQELSAFSTPGIANEVNIISCITDSDVETIKFMSAEDRKRINQQLKWMSVQPAPEFKHTVNIDGIDYSLIPKFNEMTVGEWADIDEYVHDYMANLHLITAILYRPLISAVNDKTRFIEKYDTVSLQERADLFQEKMNIADVHGAILFFSKIGMNFTSNLMSFLEEEKKNLTT